MFQDLFDTVGFCPEIRNILYRSDQSIQIGTATMFSNGVELLLPLYPFCIEELYLQKIGDVEYESPTGVASLWNSDFAERAEALDLLYDLTIDSIDDSGNDMRVVFRRNQAGNGVVNFREGEICIVYPRHDERDTVLNRQILKGTLAAITRDYVEIRFRHKQRNRTLFNENRFWAVEHDALDTTYNSMYRSLFAFLNAGRQKGSCCGE